MKQKRKSYQEIPKKNIIRKIKIKKIKKGVIKKSQSLFININK